MRIRLFSVLVTALVATGTGLARAGQPAPAKPSVCASAERRQFDFWLGTWEVFERGQPQKVADVSVTSEIDGCVIREVYEDATGLRGQSLSSYDPLKREWQQTWITNRGQLLVIHGHKQGTALKFEGWIRDDGGETRVRANWVPQGDDVRHAVERSTDGGQTWRPWFDLTFRRKS